MGVSELLGLRRLLASEPMVSDGRLRFRQSSRDRQSGLLHSSITLLSRRRANSDVYAFRNRLKPEPAVAEYAFNSLRNNSDPIFK